MSDTPVLTLSTIREIAFDGPLPFVEIDGKKYYLKRQPNGVEQIAIHMARTRFGEYFTPDALAKGALLDDYGAIEKLELALNNVARAVIDAPRDVLDQLDPMSKFSIFVAFVQATEQAAPSEEPESDAAEPPKTTKRSKPTRSSSRASSASTVETPTSG